MGRFFFFFWFCFHFLPNHWWHGRGLLSLMCSWLESPEWERGDSVQRDMTFHTTKTNTFKESEIIEESKHFQREEENNIWMHQQCWWRQNSLWVKGEQGPYVRMCFYPTFIKHKNKKCLGRNGLFASKSVCYVVNPKNYVKKMQI